MEGSQFTASDIAYLEYNYGSSASLTIVARHNDCPAFLHFARGITECIDVRVSQLCDTLHARGYSAGQEPA